MLNSSFDLLHIKNENHLAVDALQHLYTESFPAKERREFLQLLTLLHQPDMYLFALTSDKEVAGFCICWHLGDFCFLEHLAIAPSHQGRGLGRQVMQLLLVEADGKLVLEVERPVDELSRKRVRFYNGLGFTLHSTFDYHQPPYQKGGKPVPLYLMSAQPMADTAELVHIASHIKQQVYERFYFESS